ncbi:GyrI-like domain-containing protein [Fictibacillus sp. BK138]|uniref:GyrI-like domain-containing protein n=1 Tax=Fictibacillus sp. BK138 TaxID=2512121 RepID=UPI001028E63D|nr:GyrI-like domain-containing protein [Fictibacillus sp. BK138]RZT23669.1 putative transcriptional regulator YdeE [Fictibacillus sp. BK138]
MKVQLIQNLSVKEVRELKLVGFRVLCGNDEYKNEIPKAAKFLSNRLNEIKHLLNKDIQFGAFFVDSKKEEEDGYWVCVEVEKFEDIPKDMVMITIPRQRYAAANFKGSNQQIFEAYDELHQWAEDNSYKRLKNTWHIEIFQSWEDSKNLNVELLDTIK